MDDQALRSPFCFFPTIIYQNLPEMVETCPGWRLEFPTWWWSEVMGATTGATTSDTKNKWTNLKNNNGDSNGISWNILDYDWILLCLYNGDWFNCVLWGIKMIYPPVILNNRFGKQVNHRTWAICTIANCYCKSSEGMKACYHCALDVPELLGNPESSKRFWCLMEKTQWFQDAPKIWENTNLLQ